MPQRVRALSCQLLAVPVDVLLRREGDGLRAKHLLVLAKARGSDGSYGLRRELPGVSARALAGACATGEVERDRSQAEQLRDVDHPRGLEQIGHPVHRQLGFDRRLFELSDRRDPIEVDGSRGLMPPHYRGSARCVPGRDTFAA